MKNKFILFFAIVFLSSCYAKLTTVIFTNVSGAKKPCPQANTKYFPLDVMHPYYFNNKNDIEISNFLILADSLLKIHLIKVEPYLIKNGDTLRLQEVKQFKVYSFPNIINEPVLNIHFEYNVETKSSGKIENVKEDVRLYSCINTSRSVH